MSDEKKDPPGGNPTGPGEQGQAEVTPRQLAVTVFESKFAPAGKRLVLTFEQLARHFDRVGLATKEKDDLPMWSPVTAAGNKQGGEHVTKVHLVVVEYDNKEAVRVSGQRKLVDLPTERRTSVEAALALWAGHSAIAVTSWSHAPEHPKFRIVLETSRDMTPAEYSRVWRHVRGKAAAVGHILDEATSDPGRRWFVPVRREGHEYVLRLQMGKPLDVDAILAEPEPDDADKKQEWRSGTRLEAYVNRVCDAISMPDLLKADGIELRRHGSVQVASSPFRDDGRKPSFVVYDDHGFDFGTSEYYSPLRYVREKREKSFWDALEELADLARIPTAERLDRRDAGKPAIVDPTALFEALPEALPTGQRAALLRPIARAISTLDEADRKAWVEKLAVKYVDLQRRAIWNLIRQAEHEVVADDDGGSKAESEMFDVVDGRLCEVLHQRGGIVRRPIASFDAKIAEVVTEDDGAETVTRFKIEWSARGTPLPSVEVPAGDFEAMDWPVPLSAGRAYVLRGAGHRDAVRHAVLARSEPKQITRYGHTGWREVDGKWVFLHAGGAVGGVDASVSLSNPKLGRYKLPDREESKTGVFEAVERLLALLNVTPPTIGYPLLASMLSAPLASILPVRFIVALIGASGSLKTSVAIEHQSAFGDFRSDGDLPLNFLSSSAAVELTLHACKDVLVVMDDFFPRKDPRNADKQRTLADEAIRMVGNGQPRERGTRDLRLRASRPPRSVLWMTCEEDPVPASEGESAANRVLKLGFNKETVKRSVLSDIQRNGRHAVAMRAYIEQLAAVWYPGLRRELPEAHAKLRDEFREVAGLQVRQPDILATLMVSLDTFLRYFACQIGVVGKVSLISHISAAREALVEVARNQTAISTDNHPVVRWLDALKAMLRQGRTRVVARSERLSSSASCKDIGWLDKENVYLDGELADAAVKAFLAEKREYVAPSMSTIYHALVDRGWAAPPNEAGRIGTRTSNLGGGRPRVLVMPRHLFDDLALEEGTVSEAEQRRRELRTEEYAAHLDLLFGRDEQLHGVRPGVEYTATIALPPDRSEANLHVHDVNVDFLFPVPSEELLAEWGIMGNAGKVRVVFERTADGLSASVTRLLRVAV